MDCKCLPLRFLVSTQFVLGAPSWARTWNADGVPAQLLGSSLKQRRERGSWSKHRFCLTYHRTVDYFSHSALRLARARWSLLAKRTRRELSRLFTHWCQDSRLAA